jgi:hypothetical protein
VKIAWLPRLGSRGSCPRPAVGPIAAPGHQL